MTATEEGVDRERRNLGRDTIRPHQHSMEALRDPHPGDGPPFPGRYENNFG